MKPLIVLLAAFIISLFIIKLSKDLYDFALAGRIAMSVMLLFTSVGHFKFPKGMAMMLPPVIPYKKFVIYFTGVLEILGATGLLIASAKTFSAWFFIVFFIMILPANIYGAMNRVNLEKSTNDGSDLNYLWFRVPLQILFIAWIYFFIIK